MKTEHLMREIELYLRAVELCRSVGCVPTWKAECQEPLTLATSQLTESRPELTAADGSTGSTGD